jgi:hypothetical protein
VGTRGGDARRAGRVDVNAQVIVYPRLLIIHRTLNKGYFQDETCGGALQSDNVTSDLHELHTKKIALNGAHPKVPPKKSFCPF